MKAIVLNSLRAGASDSKGSSNNFTVIISNVAKKKRGSILLSFLAFNNQRFEVHHFNPFLNAPLTKLHCFFVMILQFSCIGLRAVSSYKWQEFARDMQGTEGTGKKAVPVLILNGKEGPDNEEINHSKLIPRNMLAQIIST